MFNRRFFAGIALLTLGGLVLVIYLDSRDRSHNVTADPVSMESTVSSAEKVVLEEMDLERIEYVTSILDTLGNRRARLPFYGELIRLYSESGRNFEAAGYAETMAEATDEPMDFKVAADLYFEAAQAAGNENKTELAAQKAELLYEKALDRSPGDPDIKTDLAVVYMSRLKPDRSYDMLTRVLEKDPEHIRANFNAGVLLHQMGNPDESIPFFDRSMVLAENSEWEAVVQRYLDQYHHEIYH